jgi:ubiquitin C-terminal hydrolase
MVTSIQPFYSIELPIHKKYIKNIYQSLDELSQEEYIDEETIKINSIEKLPKILILQFKRVGLDKYNEIVKIFKLVGFDMEIKLRSNLDVGVLNYSLFSVICHHGFLFFFI